MTQGSSASLDWIVTGINAVVKSLERVAEYLDDIIVVDPTSSAHSINI